MYILGGAATGDHGMACIPAKEAEFRKSIDTALEYALTLRCHR